MTYSDDSVGNRTQLNSTLAAVPPTGLLNYDANDRTATGSYDSNGNLVFNGQQNVYDFENRLVQRGGVKIVYDGDDNRVQETVAGVVTKYLVGEVNPNRLRPGAGRAFRHQPDSARLCWGCNCQPSATLPSTPAGFSTITAWTPTQFEHSNQGVLAPRSRRILRYDQCAPRLKCETI